MGGVEIGIWFGLTVGLGGIAGALLGGSIADRLGARDSRWYLFLSAIVSVPAAWRLLNPHAATDRAAR